MSCGILVPRPGIEPRASAVKTQSPNHWTAREFPQSSFRFSVNLRGRNRDHPCTHRSHNAQHSSSSALSTGVGHLLQWMNPCWYIIITQSPRFTLQFTLGVIHSTGLDKCVMMFIHAYPPLWYHTEYFHCPKNSPWSAYSYPPATHSNNGTFYCLHSLAFSRLSYNWNHTVCDLSKLASFT